MNYHYIIDSKLIFYGCKQTKRDVLDSFNEFARIAGRGPAGKVYITADLGSSEYRLGISKYYKGKRREQKAKQSPEDTADHEVFTKEYYQFIELCKKLPVTVMDVQNTEADDVASILAYDLAQDPNNRITLVTRDQDWLHSVIDHDNVKLMSTYYSESDQYSRQVCSKYTVASREEFTLKKTLEGDDGDSILHIKWLGKVATDNIWDRCLDHDEITLDVVKTETFAWIAAQSNPARYVVPYKYLEYGVAATIEEVLDVNYKLAATMIYPSQLNPEQEAQYHNAIERGHSGMTLDGFNDGIMYFGRPIILSESSERFYNVIATS